MKKLILIGLLLANGFINIKAQVPQNISDSLQHILEIYQGGNPIPGISAAVNIYDVGTWTGTSGGSFENNPLTPDMLLGIASNTKTFTATMIIKLAESGLLTLNDPLYQWLPSFENIDSTITIKQLLRHNSGVAEYWTPSWVNIVFANPDSVWTPEDVLNFVGPPLFPAGTNVSYSNTNFTLAGMIIEAATGQEYHTNIRDSILIPLNLNSTFLEGFENIVGESAHPWHLGEDVNLVPRTAITTAAYAGGCIKSTPQDMVNWYDYLFNQNFLTENGFTEMTDFINLSGSISGVGCGIFRMNYNSKTYYVHDGYIRGYSSFTMYDVEDKHSISVVRNDTFIGCENLAKALAKALNVLVVTGSKEIKNKASIKVYPNPASDFINISFQNVHREKYQVNIYDILENLIFSQYLNLTARQRIASIDISFLKAGTYIMNLSSEKISANHKIVKN